MSWELKHVPCKPKWKAKKVVFACDCGYEVWWRLLQKVARLPIPSVTCPYCGNMLMGVVT